MSVILAPQPFEGISQKELAQQIEAKKKCREKLPTWYGTPGIYYPDKRNIEQCSSEATARYKAGLIQGRTLVDLSGGLGVDSHCFADHFERAIHCEIDPGLSQLAAHNFQRLGRTNIDCLPVDGIQYLRENPQSHDWIYADPSRRSGAKGKVFLLEDCLPNIPEHLDLIFLRTDRLLLKCSPMLDIGQGIKELRSVREVQVVALQGEVKELLFLLEKGHTGKVAVKAVDLSGEGERAFAFDLEGEQGATAAFGEPRAYLYEPHAAILKAGAFKSVGLAHGLKKLHPHSHLYTSESLTPFPGRRFQILESFPYSKKALKEAKVSKANLSTRNFPLTVAELRKRHKIADGGDAYLFFTTDLNGRLIVLICGKV